MNGLYRSHSKAPAALAALLTAAAMTTPALVHAGGLEIMPGGSRAVMRGGAVAARPEDPMVLMHNPAGLAALDGDRIMLNVDVTLHSMCFDPYGYYGWGVYQAGDSEFGDPLQVELDDGGNPIIGATYATTPLPEMCNSADILPQPQMAWAGKLSEDWTLGIGFVAPTIIPGIRFGGSDGTINIDGVSFPSPTRYQIIEQKIDFAFAPSFGLAYEVSPSFAVGVNAQIAMINARTWAVQNSTSGTQPSTDWLAEVRAEDYFIPALTFGVLITPTKSLTIAGTFRWVDGLEGSGDLTYETNTFHQGATSGPVPFENDKVSLDGIEVGLPWAFTLGVRYAGLLPGGDAWPPKAGAPSDPMATELWDIELDATYNLGAAADENRVKPGDDVLIISRVAGGGTALVPTEEIEEIRLDRHQLDSFAVRLGGSYSIVPRVMQIHAGGFFESRGVEASYASIDSFAFARVGVGAGVMIRIDDVDLFAAYGHIFQETLEVVSPPHENVEDHDDDEVTSGFDKRVGGEFGRLGTREGGYVLEDPAEPAKGDATAKLQQASALPSPARPDRVINAGKYTASFDVISVGVQYRY
jgi:hypothetical protein